MAAYYSTIADSIIRFSALEPSSRENAELLLKLAAIGDDSTGKTALLKTVADNHYIEDFYLTLFSTFKISFETSSHDGILEMNDWPGLYNNMGQALPIDDIDVFLLCFAVDSPASFEHLREQLLISEIRNRIVEQQIPMILVGLKSDIRESGKVACDKLVSIENGIYFAKEIRAVAYVECSSLTGRGVHHVVEIAVNAALKQRFRKKCSIL